MASLAGYTPLVVKTDSMAPTFNAGDMIIIRQCDPATLQEGDIITFHTIIMNEYALNTHRIAQIDDMGSYRRYVTKGDNNVIEDTHVIGDGDIVGKFVAAFPTSAGMSFWQAHRLPAGDCAADGCVLYYRFTIYHVYES